MAAAVEQAAVVVLAVDFDQAGADLAQQPGRDRLVVDERLAAATGIDLAADDQRFARFDLDPGIVEGAARGMVGGERGKGRGHAGAVAALADQPAIGACAEREAERVEQDRLARAGFAGQHAQPARKLEVERLDKHNVANGKRGQHRARLNAKVCD